MSGSGACRDHLDRGFDKDGDYNRPTVPCGLCGTPTAMTGTKRCDRCWELETRIANAPDIAVRVLSQIQPAEDERVKEIREFLRDEHNVASDTTYHEWLRYLLSLLSVQPARCDVCRHDTGTDDEGRCKRLLVFGDDSTERCRCYCNAIDGVVIEGSTGQISSVQPAASTSRCVKCGHNNVNNRGECRQCIDWQRHECIFENPDHGIDPRGMFMATDRLQKKGAGGNLAAAASTPTADSSDVERWKRELTEAGWVAETAIRWRSPNGGLWRGPYGAWVELQRQKHAAASTEAQDE